MYLINDYKEKGEYIGGMKTGKWKAIYINTNKIKFQGEYLNDIEIGRHIYYYSNGNKRKEGKYKDGEKEGDWKHYNKKGELVVIYFYERGKEIKRDGIKIK